MRAVRPHPKFTSGQILRPCSSIYTVAAPAVPSRADRTKLRAPLLRVSHLITNSAASVIILVSAICF